MRSVKLAVLLAPAPAFAHDAIGQSWWSFDPWVWGFMGLLLLLRPRMRWVFAAGYAALFLALVWPFDVLSERSLAAHMAQHMLLIAVGAPLLVLARPSLPLAALPRWILASVLRVQPRAAFALHALAIWAGHAPAVIAWAIAYRWVHILEHVALLGTAALFWWALARRGQRAGGEAALWTLATMIHTGILGALLTFAPRLLYPGYTLDDQQLAGLLMWVPGGMAYLVLGLGFAAAWLQAAERAPGSAPALRRPGGTRSR